MDEKKLIILVQGHECLYNLQHKDYDNKLVKDNSWKEIAGELHAQDKELSQTQHCRRMAS
jgi:5'(3')-deoxyribonucleotidase